jgi:hypothetical protein
MNPGWIVLGLCACSVVVGWWSDRTRGTRHHGPSQLRRRQLDRMAGDER